MDCFDDDVLRQYLSGALLPEEADACREHLDGCAQCAARLDVLAAQPDALSLSRTPRMGAASDTVEPPVTGGHIARGSSIGRFLVLELLGRGGMGEVYAAFDPQLNRRVALKLLLPHGEDDADGDGGAKERLLREAQAMAQLSHPNVVPVFDVGEHAGRVFIAMELVEGQTLRAWLKAARPAWPEVVRRFLDAGRGLAAAHVAGLVHRDFKPDNVLLSREGRVYVLDFGLARAGDVQAFAGPASTGSGGGLPSGADALEALPTGALPTATFATGLLRTRVTQSRGAVGTAGFMPPEQIRGEALDARADVFAFCASLYYALYGQRPFDGADVRSLLSATLAGRVLPPPRGAKVPAWLHRVLLRGLAADRDQRFASMDVLLGALQDDPAVRRRRWAAAAAVLLVLGAAGTGYRWVRARQVAACGADGAALAADWHARQGDVERAFLATGKPFAAHSWRSVRATLDRYTGALGAVAEGRCLAVRVRQEAPAETLALHQACLAQRQVEVAALLDVLVKADGQVVERAPQAAQELPPPGPCADAAWVARQGPPPATPEAAERMRGLRAALSQAKALHRLGKYQGAIAAAQPVVEGARALGYPQLEAEALLQLGASEYSFGTAAEAERHLREAARRGLSSGRDIITAQAAVVLVQALASSAERVGEARLWFDWGMDLAARAPEENARVLVRLHGAHGYLHQRHGNHAEAEEARRQAFVLAKAAYGEDATEVASRALQLAEALSWRQKHAEAEGLFQQALATLERSVGPEHPQMSHLLDVMGTHYLFTGRNAEALAAYQRALAISERTLDPRAFRLGVHYNNLAAALSELGRHAEAADALRRALAVHEGAAAPPHATVAQILVNLAGELAELGRHAEARASAERALALAQEKLKGHATALRDAWLALALVDVKQGRPRDALPRLERVLRAEGAGEPDVGGVYAQARFLLAQALRATGQRRHEVPGLAAAARDGFVAANRRLSVAEVEAWAKGAGLVLPPHAVTRQAE